MLEAKRRVGSSPDNGGTGQHLQMVWVRQARRKGATKVNQWLNPLKRLPRLQPVGCGPDSSARRLGNETATPKSEYRGRRGGHEESLRRTRGEAAGEELGANPVDRCMVKRGNHLGIAQPVAQPVRRRAGPLSAVGPEVGRRVRSSPSVGKPRTWRRDPASEQ